MENTLLYVLLGTVSAIIFIHLRGLRLKNIKTQVLSTFVQKEQSLFLTDSNKKNINESHVDHAQYIGVAIYNFITIKDAEGILANSEEALGAMSSSVKENLIFRGMELRNQNFDFDANVDLFKKYLDSNQSLLKGDLGEQISAEQYRQAGYDIELPMNLDGSWKSNNPDFDFIAKKGDLEIRVNPKVGYESNFSKIEEQARENPDVLYEVGSQHAESVEDSGLGNIVINEGLSSGNIQQQLDGFKDQLSSYDQSHLQVVQDQSGLAESIEHVQEFGVEDLPLLSAAINGSRQFKLCREGIVSPGEAVVNTLTKTTIKTGAIYGAQALIGSIGFLGGPVGIVAAGFIGAYIGSGVGQSVYSALFSGNLVDLLKDQGTRISKIAELVREDAEVKIHQIDNYLSKIKLWDYKHPFQVLWPTKAYVYRIVLGDFLKEYQIELINSKSNLTSNHEKLEKLNLRLNDIGFFRRLVGSHDNSEKELNQINKEIFESIMKMGGVIRNAQLQESLSSWEINQMKIVNEKKKLAA